MSIYEDSVYIYELNWASSYKYGFKVWSKTEKKGDL